MVEQYFSAPKTLQRMRSGPCSAYLDGFVESLRRDGYTPTSIRRSLRAATHLGVFLTRRRQSVAELDAPRSTHSVGICCTVDVGCRPGDERDITDASGRSAFTRT